MTQQDSGLEWVATLAAVKGGWLLALQAGRQAGTGGCGGGQQVNGV